MWDIVFSESAAGSLKMAQHYGEGKFPLADIGIAFLGNVPSQDEVIRARQKAIEAEHRRWEEAVPLGGDPGKVLCLPGAWDYGPVQDAPDGPARCHALEQLLTAVMPQAAGQAAQYCDGARRNLDRLLAAAHEGQPLRIWAGQSASDACGLRWLMSRLVKAGTNNEIRLVLLPPYKKHGNQTVRCRDGGDLHPGEWGRLLPGAFVLSSDQQQVLAAEWDVLESENAPLRVSINGQLLSVSENFYDPFLQRTISALPDSFSGAALISQLLTDYPCFGGDSFLWMRICAMIRAGELEQLTTATAGEPSYACQLRKCPKGC